MKTFTFSYMLLVTSVFFAMIATTKAQVVKDDGNVIQENRIISSFDRIESNGIMNIFLTQGDAEFVVIEADKNIIPYIETNVKGNRLSIGTKEDAEINKSTKMNVYITFRNIHKLELNGVGNSESQNQLDLKDLTIVNSGVGNLKLNLDCEKLKLEMNSFGNAVLTGRVNNASIDHNGVGNLKAFDLTTNIMNIQSNGVGNSEVSSDNEIYISLNGMGNVSYKGNAVVKELNKNGFGNVKKM